MPSCAREQEGKEKSQKYKETVFREQIDEQKEDAPSIKGGGAQEEIQWQPTEGAPARGGHRR